MQCLSRYVGIVVFSAITLALFVLVGLDVVAAIIDQLDDIQHNYRFFDVLIYVSTTLPSTVYDYIPLASLIGCLLGLGLLANNGEIIIMRASGVSLLRIVYFAFRPVLLFVLLAMMVGEYLSPYLDQLAESRREYLRKGDSTLNGTSGIWHREGREFAHINAVFPGGVLYGVTRYKFLEDHSLEQVSFSTRATYNVVENVWVEENVSITRFSEQRTETEKLTTRYWITELTPQLLTLNVLPADALSIKRLRNYISFLRQQGLDVAHHELVFWNKVLYPLVIMGLVLVGISFVFGPLRDATVSFRIFIGVFLGVSFNLVQDILGPLGIVFQLPPIFSVALPISLCGCVGLYLLRRSG